MKKNLLFAVFTLVGLSIIGFLIFTVRQSLANRAIAAEWAVAPAITPTLRPTTKLEITPLYEALSARDGLIGGNGVSYLIRTDASTILLDVGDNPENLAAAPFVQNMQALGIDWREIERVVISHPHPDHVGGASAWLRNTVHFGELPGGMGDRMVFIPTNLNVQGGIHATIPSLPALDIATTGVIAYAEVFPLSVANPKGYEQALVVHVDAVGLVLITGCGHPGLERLVERAESLYGQRVVAVVGGLHYKGARAEQVDAQIRFLQSRQPVLVALSAHDSGPAALAAFQSAFGDCYHSLRVGEPIHLP